MKRDRRVMPRWQVLLLIGGAVPIAFAFESLLRALVFPASFELVREELRSTLTPVAWTLCVLALPSVPLGWWAQAVLVRNGLARAPDASPTKRTEIGLEAMLLSSSIPQVPALLATVTYMFGATLVPVAVTVAISTAGVVAQALQPPPESRGSS